MKVYANDGISKQVFEWGFWKRNCQAGDITIKITKGPKFGITDIGRGTMIIGRTSASGARMACESSSVATKVVNYTANKGFVGVDKFRLSVFSPYSPPRLFDVEINVRLEYQ